MPFPPDGFLAFADSLKSGSAPAGEARYRTTANRAYYGLYWATCAAVCDAHGVSPACSLPHETLSHALAGAKMDADVRKVGNCLNSLRQLRIRADYKLAKPLSKEDAEDAVSDAQTAFAELPAIAARLPKVDPQ